MTENIEEFKSSLEKAFNQMRETDDAYRALQDEWWNKAKDFLQDEEVQNKLEKEYIPKIKEARKKADDALKVLLGT